MAIGERVSAPTLEDSYKLNGTDLRFSPFHSGKLIATASDLERGRVGAVSIANAGHYTYFPSDRLFAVIADLERETLTFWITAQNPTEAPLRQATYSTQKASIYFITPPRLGPGVPPIAA